MKKRILLFLISMNMVVSFMPTYAEEAYIKAENINILCNDFTIGTEDANDKLQDGHEETAVVIKDAKNSEINIEIPNVGNVTKVRIAVKNFPAWQNVKTISIKSGDKSISKDVSNVKNNIEWIEVKTDFDNISNLSISFDSLWKSLEYTAIAVSEVEVYLDKSSAKKETVNVERRLVYGTDFTIEQNSPAMGGWEYALSRCFDDNSTTIGGLGDLTDGFLLFRFNKPTDVSKIGFRTAINGDWAVPKIVRCKVYNEETVYRKKLTNPEPIWNGKDYELQNSGIDQEIVLSVDENFKKITHLMVKIDEAYISATKATWGGWYEMWIDGTVHEEEKATSEIVWRDIKSNAEILSDMGVIDFAVTEATLNDTPTKIDMVKTILRLNDEYDNAVNYHGTFNFSDADSENYNILSYIYAYKRFGIVGNGANEFKPNEPLTARACYLMLLSLLGYEAGKDFTWNDMQKLLYHLGFGDMIFENNFTNLDMCNAIYEAFYVPIKGSEKYYIDMLREVGRINSMAQAKIDDKQDRFTPITDGDYQVDESVDRNGDFTFTYNQDEHIVEPGSFTYNCPFHYAGIYYGTLPEDDERSKRKEFGEMMTKAGARAMRFPGGLPAHQYFIEGEEYAIQFDKKTKRFGVTWTGLYDSDDYNNAWYVDFWNWLDFCKEYNIEPVFQTNPCFFVNTEGEVKQAYPCFIYKNTDKGLITSDELYDHDRIDEAIAAFDKNLDEIVSRGYSIHYWEIGNEDNYQNYSTLPLSDPKNPLSNDFIEAVTGYVRSIKKHFPDAYIMVPNGFPYKEFMSKEDYELIDAVTVHYPFGQWSIPPVEENDSAARLAHMNEQNFVGYFSKKSFDDVKKNGELPLANTETMAWRYEGWNASSLQHTFAQALNTAHNWGELVFDSGFVDINVMHDLESPWFGNVVYDVSIDPGNRCVTWNRNVSYTVHKDDVPKMYQFADSYYTNPASKAFELLGRHCGDRVLTNSQTNVNRMISGYASIDEESKEIRFTIVNRFNETIPVNIALPNVSIPEQTVSQYIMRSDYLRAMIDVEYENYEVPLQIIGNTQNELDSAVVFDATPHSINQFVVKIDEIKAN